jgi:hypothetical protein
VIDAMRRRPRRMGGRNAFGNASLSGFWAAR